MNFFGNNFSNSEDLFRSFKSFFGSVRSEQYMDKESALTLIQELKDKGVSFTVESEMMVSVKYRLNGVDCTLTYTQPKEDSTPENFTSSESFKKELREQIEEAVKKEDYNLAAKLKKQLDSVK